MEAALQSGAGNVPLTMSATGYQLLHTLVRAGTSYDLLADDGANNVTTYAVLLNIYIGQASPVFLELDRLTRWIWSLYSATAAMTPQIAFDFGVITAAQQASWISWLATAPLGLAVPAGAAVPTLSAPAALPFLYTGSNFATVSTRLADAITLCTGNYPTSTAPLTVLLDGSTAWNSGVWWDNASPPVSHALTSPPTNPSTTAESFSVSFTSGINIAVANCQAWLSAVSFT